MNWVKAVIWGCVLYWALFLISFVTFVILGLGYTFPKAANITSWILTLPTNTNKSGNLILGMVLWSTIFALIIKTIFSFKK